MGNTISVDVLILLRKNFSDVSRKFNDGKKSPKVLMKKIKKDEKDAQKTFLAESSQPSKKNHSRRRGGFVIDAGYRQQREASLKHEKDITEGLRDMDRKVKTINEKPMLMVANLDHDEAVPTEDHIEKVVWEAKTLKNKFNTSKMSPAMNHAYKSRKLSNPLFHKSGDPLLKITDAHFDILSGDKSTLPEFKKLIA